MPQVVFLAFADHQADSLAALEAEFAQVRRLLTPLDAREYIKLVPYGKTTLDQMTQNLDNYAEQLALFHYAGHAAGDRLQLLDGPGFGQGLASLLGGLPHLQLVFLNGCATVGHVKGLLEAGVKAVIATAAPVGDQMAHDFSIAFYRALANKRTIGQAFEFAKGEVELRHKTAPDIAVRTAGFAEEEAEPTTLSWGLYVQPDAKQQILSWRLPYHRDTGLADFLKEDIHRKVKTNQYIVRVLDRMSQINKDIHANYLVEYREGKAYAKDPKYYLDAVIQSFPWVIGSQIQLLRQKHQPGMPRLEQLLSTYIITGQLLYYILLSDGWEYAVRREKPLSAELSNGLLPASQKELEAMDFLGRLGALYQSRPQDNLQLSVPELEEFATNLLNPSHPLYKAHHLLQDLRTTHAAGAIPDPAAACDQAEKALAILLSEAAFLAGYHLLTVRNISLDNPRTRPLQYELELGRLNALVYSSLGLYEDAAYRRKQHYSECRSIVLTPSEKDLHFSLNLSPFVIDKNTFLGQPTPDLFLYAYSEAGVHYYYSVNHDFYTALANRKGFDLIHTGMTLEDFDEGRNDLSEDDAWGDYFDEPAATQGTPVFDLLAEQHQCFLADITPKP